MTPITKAIVIENSAAVLMARITGIDGEAITADDIDSIECRIYDRDTGELVAQHDLDENEVIVALTTDDARWTVDDEGFNFVAELSGDNWPDGGHIYRAEITIHPGGGDSYKLLYDLKAIEVLGE